MSHVKRTAEARDDDEEQVVIFTNDKDELLKAIRRPDDPLSATALRDSSLTTPGADAGASAARAAFNRPCELLLVLLPPTSAGLYNEVKQATDSHLSIVSQCCVMAKASIGPRAQLRGRMHYAANLALKVGVCVWC